MYEGWPYSVVWYIWAFMMYKAELLVCIALAYVHYVYSRYQDSLLPLGSIPSSIDLSVNPLAPLAVGVCAWMVYYAYKQGYIVG